ncbi:bifunctional non-homologous end joining protein LigD [Fictibacillus solisalsi]|uniref:DNA ligase (ATP) n=1 Tax=Fictibacillus solisalsi TaxID=459525 RepID=A0A1G9VFZ6_9BACL|nr:RNA ligase family protein [Fictibacillus solisalsi]SDM71030.1 bifunctional non-homologous end joining protein LigD [Fictibacillus solisalsi]
MDPLFPMEPKSATDIPSSSKWISQIKWDGVHVLTYFDGKTTRLFNRKKRERTTNYPELVPIHTYCSAESVILDGEVIALGDNGRPSFHKVMRRDGVRNLDRVRLLQHHVPITYMIFDVLFYNGEWITKWPLEDRITLLSDIITPNDHVQLVRSHPDGEALFKAVKSSEMEGIIMKQLHSYYYIGEKNEVWLKIKNTLDVNAVIGGFTLNSGVVNAVLLGLYDDQGQFVYIGHTGTGKFTVQDWRNLTMRLLKIETSQLPFVNPVERHRDAYWVKPEVTAKIHFAEWTEAGKLRQPSIQALLDIPPSECTFQNT